MSGVPQDPRARARVLIVSGTLLHPAVARAYVAASGAGEGIGTEPGLGQGGPGPA